MSNVGQRERATQNRIVQFFQTDLGYRYLGDLQDRANNKNIEVDILVFWLKKRGVSEALINRAIRQLDTAAALGEGKKLYYANKEVYRLLRYGVKDKEALFLSNRKTRISPKTVQHIVDEYLEKSGLSGQGFSTHKLRHTAATLMYQYGHVDVLQLKEILGHENLSTTEIYTHVVDEQLRAVLQRTQVIGFDRRLVPCNATRGSIRAHHRTHTERGTQDHFFPDFHSGSSLGLQCGWKVTRSGTGLGWPSWLHHGISKKKPK